MKKILSACLILGGVFAARAQTNSIPAARVMQPVLYTNRVQMHHVPLGFKTPDQIRREEEQGARSAGLGQPGTAPALDEQQIIPPAPPITPRIPTKKREREENWLDRPDTSDRKRDKKNEASGWGWLADEVRLVDQRRHQGESKETERVEDEKAQGDVTNRAASAGDSWSGSRRAEARELASRDYQQPSRTYDMAVPRDRVPGLGPSSAAAQAEQDRQAQDSSFRSWSPGVEDRPAPSPLERAGVDRPNPLNPASLGSPSLGWATPGQAEDRRMAMFETPGLGHVMEPVLTTPTDMGASMNEPTPLFQAEAGGFTAGPASPSLPQPSLFDSAPANRPILGQEAAVPGIQTKTLPW